MGRMMMAAIGPVLLVAALHVDEPLVWTLAIMYAVLMMELLS